MDTSNIPKSFWHALSICMLTATFGILFIAYKSSTFSIEIANAKLTLSSAIATAKDIQNDLEQENERLKKDHKELQDKLHSVRADVAKIVEDPSISDDFKEFLKSEPLDSAKLDIPPIDPRIFTELGTKIEQVEKAIEIK